MKRKTYSEATKGMKKISDRVSIGETDFSYTLVERSNEGSETAYSIKYVKKEHLNMILEHML